MFKRQDHLAVLVRMREDDLKPDAVFTRGMSREAAEDAEDVERQRLNMFHRMVIDEVYAVLCKRLDRWSFAREREHFVFRCDVHSEHLAGWISKAVGFIMDECMRSCMKVDLASHLRRVDF